MTKLRDDRAPVEETLTNTATAHEPPVSPTTLPTVPRTHYRVEGEHARGGYRVRVARGRSPAQRTRCRWIHRRVVRSHQRRPASVRPHRPRSGGLRLCGGSTRRAPRQRRGRRLWARRHAPRVAGQGRREHHRVPVQRRASSSWRATIRACCGAGTSTDRLRPNSGETSCTPGWRGWRPRSFTAIGASSRR